MIDRQMITTLPWRRRLVFQLAILILLAMVLPLLFLGSSNIQTSRAQTLNYTQQVNLTEAELAAEQIVSHVERAITDLSSLAGSPPLRAGDWRAAQTELERLQARRPDLSLLTLLDTEGNERVKVSTTALFLPEALGSQAQSPGFRTALGEKTYMGVEHVSVFGHGQRLPLAVPVFDESRQRVIGVLAAELALRNLLDSVGAVQVGESGYAYVVADDGHIIAHPDFSFVLAHADASAIIEVQDILAGREERQETEFSRYNALTGEPVFGVHASLPGLGGGVIVEQSAGEVLAPVQAQTVRLSVLLGVTLLLSMGLVFYVTRFLAWPITRLTEAAQRLAAGERRVRAPVERQNEVGLLAVAFNRMVENIQHAQANLVASEERYRGLFNSASDGLYVVDMQGHYLDVNAAACRLLGYRREELLEMDVLQIGLRGRGLSPEEHAKLLEQLQVLWRQGASGYETQLVAKSGALIPVEMTITPLTYYGQEAVLGAVRDITGRVRAQAALQASEARYQDLYDNAPDMFASVDAQTAAILQCNQTLATALGYSKEEIVGRPIFDMYHPDCMEAVENTFRTSAETGELHDVELQLQRKDGSKIDVSLNLSAVRDDQGKIIHSRSIWRDVSAKKQAAEALLESEKKYRVLFETMAVGVVYQAADDGAIISANPAAERILGLTLDQMKGRTSVDSRWKAIHQDGSDFPGETHPAIVALQTSEEVRDVVMGVFNPDQNDYRWIKISATPQFRPGERQPYQVYTTFDDITGRKRIEEALQASERLLSSIIDQSPFSTWIADATGTQIRQNAACRKLFGIESDEQTVGKYNLLEDPVLKEQGFQEQIRRVFTHGEVARLVNEYDLAAVDQIDVPGATHTTLQGTIFPVKDQDGKVVNVVIQHEDITARVQAEEELGKHREHLEEMVAERTAEVEKLNSGMIAMLEDLKITKQEVEETAQRLQETNAELETFTYSVSHDLKAPLRGIDGYSRLLLEDYVDKLDEDGRFFLHTIRRATQQMKQLIDDLLAYSRLQRRRLAIGTVNPRRLVETLLAERASEIEAQGITIRVDIPCDSVAAEAEGLAQALRNLLDNAIKFSRDVADPHIEVGGRADDKNCTLWVRDNGPGFNVKYHDRIFEIFQRLHSVEDYPGTGIGLAIVRKAMGRMNGRVWAESEPGEGAVFYVEIPRGAGERG